MTGTAMTEAAEFDKVYEPRRGRDPDQQARSSVPTSTT
jgi:preprotein translocase subunit SecA